MNPEPELFVVERLHWVERIEQPAFAGRVGHELRDALRARTAAGDGPVERALALHRTRLHTAPR